VTTPPPDQQQENSNNSENGSFRHRVAQPFSMLELRKDMTVNILAWLRITPQLIPQMYRLCVAAKSLSMADLVIARPAKDSLYI
jgi:hypothetical protein